MWEHYVHITMTCCEAMKLLFSLIATLSLSCSHSALTVSALLCPRTCTPMQKAIPSFLMNVHVVQNKTILSMHTHSNWGQRSCISVEVMHVSWGQRSCMSTEHTKTLLYSENDAHRHSISARVVCTHYMYILACHALECNYSMCYGQTYVSCVQQSPHASIGCKKKEVWVGWPVSSFPAPHPWYMLFQSVKVSSRKELSVHVHIGMCID